MHYAGARMSARNVMLADKIREAEATRLRAPAPLVWHDEDNSQFSQEFEHGRYEVRGAQRS